MECPKCDFDFKRYPFVSWKLMRFKYDRNKTYLRVGMVVFWIFVPTLLVACLSLVLIMKGNLILGIPFLCFVSVPILTLFTILPVVALLKKDCLRDIKDKHSTE